MNTPKPHKPYVKSFCWIIAKNTPVLVPLRPQPFREVSDCFNIVSEHIITNGGKQVIGWAIFEWPKVTIEAEFHCVWEDPNGELIDLTPRPNNLTSILFLPDPKQKYLGRQVDNIRKPLNNNPAIRNLIKVLNQIYVEQNKGDLADYHGKITVEGKLANLLKEKETIVKRLANRYGRPRGV